MVQFYSAPVAQHASAVDSYNRERPHSGRYCYGKTPWETFQASKPLALEKDLSRGGNQSDNTVLQPTAVS